VNRDRRKDLVCSFVAARVMAGIVLDEACVSGFTFGGRPLRGCERLEVVPRD
jgi:hypothetical protein